jgi:imidazolonepropionase-like amidohydrolase
MKWSAGFAALFLCLASVAVPSSDQSPRRIWIADVTIVSPENLGNVTVGSVLIENGRIARVERAKNAPAPAGAVVISGKGQFLIPGLIDSHVHLASVPGADESPGRQPPPEVLGEYFKQLPRSYLYFGYTTLVDLAVIDRRVLDHFRQAPLHPDLYDCGPSLPVANGYPMSFAPPEIRFQLFPNWLLDPDRTTNLPAKYDPRRHTPAAAVAAVKDSGGICVKTYFERGFGADRNLPVITPALIAQVRDAAHARGLVLMMHANSFEAHKFAVDAKVDVIAHGMWNWGDLSSQTEVPPEIKSVLDRMVEEKIGFQATMQVMEGGFRAYFDPDYLRMRAVAKVTPPKLLAWFNSPEGKWFKQEIAGGDISDVAAREGLDRGPIRRGRQVVGYLAARNARFLFGTDTPSAPSYGNLPGLNGYLEMQDLCRAGLSLRQIFLAATIENARMFRLDSQVGTIEPGKIANLLLLSKSPLQTIEAYDSITTTFVHGMPISRESLAADQ